MVHGFARQEIDDARDRVEGGNYESATTFVENSQADIRDESEIDYGKLGEQYDELVEAFVAEAGKEYVYDPESRTRERPDDNKLHALLNALDATMDQIEPLRDEFQRRCSRFRDPRVSDEELPAERQETCISCHRNPVELSESRIFPVDILEGDRYICGKCLCELDVVAHADVEGIDELSGLKPDDGAE